MNGSHAYPRDAVRIAEVAVRTAAAALAAMKLAFASLASGGTATLRETVDLAQARVDGRRAVAERLRAETDPLSGRVPDEPPHAPRPWRRRNVNQDPWPALPPSCDMGSVTPTRSCACQ